MQTESDSVDEPKEFTFLTNTHGDSLKIWVDLILKNWSGQRKAQNHVKNSGSGTFSMSDVFLK